MKTDFPYHRHRLMGCDYQNKDVTRSRQWMNRTILIGTLFALRVIPFGVNSTTANCLVRSSLLPAYSGWVLTGDWGEYHSQR